LVLSRDFTERVFGCGFDWHAKELMDG